MSASRRLSAMAVPPAATMARFDADLSMIALEAIGTQQNLLNQSPGSAGPACLLTKSRRGANPAVFLTQAIPPPREHACENRRDHMSLEG
ncbi:hypothetical protein MPLA_230008 [Mesorhizobium sp. ORS 3359]|nr:hypothetical protein MPLA_230008 [Mesorhizobium sp. ORS 3359]